ncbi:MAG: HD domain-containing protein [Pseudonocardiales bacterium]|nr:HD domain-containing protein [Pseudonocardiales bacterium]
MAVHAKSERLAELTIALSLATDPGTGQPMEHGLRTCWLSLATAEALGLDAATRSCVYYVALLRFLGCTSDASETAVLAGGDEVAFNATMAPMLMAQTGESIRYFVRHLAEDLPPHSRAGRVARAMSDPGLERRSLSGHCDVAARLAVRLGMALAHAYERWDGNGLPAGLAGEDVPVAVRIDTVARDAELWARQGGWPAAAEVLAQRRGHAYDPAVVEAIIGSGRRWLTDLGDDPRGAVLDSEPALVLTLRTRELDNALAAIADFADLKSPFLRTHSAGVADLAVAAATAAGVSEAEATTLGRAALVHDVGRVGISSGIWNYPGPLNAQQWERVRLHPYLSERVLHNCTLLEAYADLAGCHHERADGSGYHRGTTGNRLSFGARLLAAADAYHAMTEDRPHRPARTPADAAEQLLVEVDAGRFARVEVGAVLDAAGQERRQGRPALPAGLTEREVDVLRLIARGRANKQVGVALGISPKTVGHTSSTFTPRRGSPPAPGSRCSLWRTDSCCPDRCRGWGERPMRRRIGPGNPPISV